MSQAWQIRDVQPTSWLDLSALSNLKLNASVPVADIIPPRSALVRMRAAALNARDFMVVAHDPIYPGDHIDGLVPCADGAGEIVAAGAGSIWKVGEKVIIHPNAWLEDTEELRSLESVHAKGSDKYQGTLRQHAIWDDGELLRGPHYLSFEELAAIPACGATAMNALFYGPRPFKKGMVVLAQGTGGVSCFVIQIAAAAGATVIATSSSDVKLELARTLGATHVINYVKTPDWAAEARRLTDGKGIDHVVDIAGSATIQQSVRAAKHGGLITLVGFLTESTKVDLVSEIVFGGKTLRGLFNFTKPMHQAMVDLYEQQHIRPLVAKVFEWTEAKEAFRMLNEQSAVGKIVIRI